MKKVHPPVGSLLFLRVVEGTRAKAVVGVVAVASERRNVNMTVDQVLDVAYIEGVRNRAPGMSDPPGGAIVAPRVIENPSDLEREADGDGRY